MKKQLLLAIFIFSIISITVKAQTWQWAKTSNAYTETGATAVDQSGNVFVTGYYGGGPLIAGSHSLNTPTGNLSVYVIKYDPLGNPLWAKGSMGTSQDFPPAICTDFNGNSIVCGYFDGTSTSFGTYTLTNNGSKNIFIVKYDPNGNVLWAKGSSGTANNIAYGVSTDTNNNVYVTGEYNSPTITFGTNTLTNSGFINMFIVKYDQNGNELWAKNSIASRCRAHAIDTDMNNNTIVTGIYSSGPVVFNSHTLTSTSPGDAMFLVNYDQNGNVTWAKTPIKGTSVGVEPYAITIDQLGNSYIAGNFSGSPLVFGTTTLSGVFGNLFIVKYDPLGSPIWANKIVGNGLYTFSIDSYSNGVFVAGTMDQNGTAMTINNFTFNPPSGYVDPAFLLQYDLNGNLLHGETLTSGGESAIKVAVDNFCNAYVHAGFYNINPCVIGTTSLAASGTGGENMYTAKFTFNCNASVGRQEFYETESVYLFPNPTSGLANLRIDNELESGVIVLVNGIGQTVHQQKVAKGNNQINLLSLPRGMYFYDIKEYGKSVFKGKIIISGF